MANYRAVANGDWSNLATWEDNAGGSFVASTVLPGASDDVYANNFIVGINQNVTVLSLRNTISTSIVVGGGFNINGNYTITADTFIGNGNNQFLFRLPVVYTVNLNGFCNGSRFIDITSTSTVNIVGDILNGLSYFNITANCTINLTGNIKVTNSPNGVGISTSSTFNMVINGTVTAGSSNNNHTMSLGGAANITINGIVEGNISGASTGASSITSNSVLSIVTINGICQGGSSTYVGVSTSGTCIVNGIMKSNSSEAVAGGGLFYLNGSMDSLNGVNAAPVRRLYWNVTGGKLDITSTDTITTNTLYPPGTALGNPTPSDVRDGTTYADGALTGTLKVPPSSSVAVGVPVDNTTGTAIITVTDMGALLASYVV
jgi:hypothetical protein